MDGAMVLHAVSTPGGSSTQMKITKETLSDVNHKAEPKAGETEFQMTNFTQDHDQPMK